MRPGIDNHCHCEGATATAAISSKSHKRKDFLLRFPRRGLCPLLGMTWWLAAAYKAIAATKNAYIQPEVIHAIQEGTINFKGLSEAQTAVQGLDFNFLGIDLTAKPQFNIDIFNHFDKSW